MRMPCKLRKQVKMLILRTTPRSAMKKAKTTTTCCKTRTPSSMTCQKRARPKASKEQAKTRMNLKLKLLGVRLSLLSRQIDPARSELAAVTASLNRYFDPSSRRVQVAATQLQQLQLQIRAVEPPRLDDTFAALSTAVAGR